MPRSLLLAASLAWALTACTGSESAPTPTPTPTPVTPSTAAAGAGPTQPGTDLDFGESATLVWQPGAGVTGSLELSVEEVSQEPQSVFRGWVRDKVILDSRPYFVTVSLTNTGVSDLAGQAVPLYLRDDTGTLGAPWTLGGDFAACQSGPLPDPFEAGDETEMCLVYLVPDRARIADMVFEPTEGYDPISWTGEVVKSNLVGAGRSGTGAPGSRAQQDER